MAIVALVTKLQLDGKLGIETPFYFANTPQGCTKKSTPREGIELNDRLSGVLS